MIKDREALRGILLIYTDIFFARHSLKKRKGQTTIECLLMLASVVAAALVLVMLFYRKLLGAVFTIIGLIIGAGTPQK